METRETVDNQSKYKIEMESKIQNNFTTEKGDINIDLYKYPKVVEEIINYEQKLEKMMVENELSNKAANSLEENSEKFKKITDLSDNEMKELFKRQFKRQLIKRDIEKSLHQLKELDNDNKIDHGKSIQKPKPPDSKTKIWKAIEIDPYSVPEYSSSFGRITLKENDLPKNIGDKYDSSFEFNERKATILSEQVKKMKYGIEKLNSVFSANYTDKYKKDIDFLTANITPYIQNLEKEKKLKRSKKPKLLPEQRKSSIN